MAAIASDVLISSILVVSCLLFKSICQSSPRQSHEAIEVENKCASCPPVPLSLAFFFGGIHKMQARQYHVDYFGFQEAKDNLCPKAQAFISIYC